MLIEQIIKFELKGLGPFGRMCTPATSYFHEKTKISKENLGVDYYLLENIARGNVHCFPVPGPIFLQNQTSKCKILNVFWT